MSTLAQLEPRRDGFDGRNAARRKLKLQTSGSTSIRGFADVVIHDLSETGVLIETAAELSTGELLDVHIPEVGATAAKVVWNNGRLFGCEFESRISRAAVSAAMLRSPAAAPSAAPFASEPGGGEKDFTNEESRPRQWSFRAKLRLIVALALGFWILNRLILWIFF